MAQGVEYEIDLTRPVGDRVRNLRWNGKPLAPEQKLRIALNNYRKGGSAGYSMFIDAKVVWRSADEIRDLMGGITPRGSLCRAKRTATGGWFRTRPDVRWKARRWRRPGGG